MQRRVCVSVMAGLALPVAQELPARLGSVGVDQLHRHTARLRRMDDLMGGGDTYGIYAQETQRTTRLLNTSTHTDAVWRALRSLPAEQEQLAGWAAFDAGNQARARCHYQASLADADEAGNEVLAGNAHASAGEARQADSRARVGSGVYAPATTAGLSRTGCSGWTSRSPTL